MPFGKVKWFNNKKKYGFISTNDKEVFVHFSAILKDGYKTLKKDQLVEYEVVEGPKGERAVNVKILPSTNVFQRPIMKSSNRFSFIQYPHHSSN